MVGKDSLNGACINPLNWQNYLLIPNYYCIPYTSWNFQNWPPWPPPKNFSRGGPNSTRRGPKSPPHPLPHPSVNVYVRVCVCACIGVSVSVKVCVCMCVCMCVPDSIVNVWNNSFHHISYKTIKILITIKRQLYKKH